MDLRLDRPTFHDNWDQGHDGYIVLHFLHRVLVLLLLIIPKRFVAPIRQANVLNSSAMVWYIIESM